VLSGYTEAHVEAGIEQAYTAMLNRTGPS
jgi:hypothetical protein